MEKKDLEDADSSIRQGSGNHQHAEVAGSFVKRELLEDPDAHLSEEERKKIVRSLPIMVFLL